MNRVLLLPAGFMMVLLFVMVGCSRKGTSTITTEVSDSVHVREVTRFISVNTPGDTVQVDHFIECDPATNKPKPFSIKNKSKQASVMLNVDSSGKVTATGICDSLNKVIEVKDKEIFRLRTESRNKEIVQPEYITRGIDKFCRWFTGVAILVITGLILHKLKYF